MMKMLVELTSQWIYFNIFKKPKTLTKVVANRAKVFKC